MHALHTVNNLIVVGWICGVVCPLLIRDLILDVLRMFSNAIMATVVETSELKKMMVVWRADSVGYGVVKPYSLWSCTVWKRLAARYTVNLFCTWEIGQRYSGKNPQCSIMYLTNWRPFSSVWHLIKTNRINGIFANLIKYHFLMRDTKYVTGFMKRDLLKLSIFPQLRTLGTVQVLAFN